MTDATNRTPELEQDGGAVKTALAGKIKRAASVGS